MPNPRHAAVMLAYDHTQEQTQLTVQALESLLAQDIGPMQILLIDNGSTHLGTWEHFQMIRDLYLDRCDRTEVHIIRNRTNISPVKLTNHYLDYFWDKGHEKVFGIPNDVIIPPNCYRLMNEWPRGLVTGSETPSKNFPILETAEAVDECTPAAVCVVRKWFHDALVAQEGHFLDPNFFMYASDCDFAVRMALCGLRGIKLNVEYWHFRSASHLLAPTSIGEAIRSQADRDRAYFMAKYGFAVDSWEYGQCGEINFALRQRQRTGTKSQAAKIQP